jgi:hypothetical protein
MLRAATLLHTADAAADAPQPEMLCTTKYGVARLP